MRKLRGPSDRSAAVILVGAECWLVLAHAPEWALVLLLAIVVLMPFEEPS